MTATRVAIIAFWGLFGLQFVWHLWWAPPRVLPVWLVATLVIAPLIPVAIGLLRGRPRALLWGGILSLFYFCHGISEWWSAPDVRILAIIETLLCVTLVLALGWSGRGRKANRPAAD